VTCLSLSGYIQNFKCTFNDQVKLKLFVEIWLLSTYQVCPNFLLQGANNRLTLPESYLVKMNAHHARLDDKVPEGLGEVKAYAEFFFNLL